MKLACIEQEASSQLSHGQSIAPSPAAAEGPSSDGTAIDQGIAYVLLVVALAITYLIH
ncbi:Arabinogalactan peptide, AGP [Trema orientale]|uniref:Arabinogalactan peptide, AGP n=1 Tax=Trema orientale TaxID=63057 RepID=A0A2P5F9U3_TREOI|nr:Arabinogalactan peptide, AGP [Trema orientale]